MKPQRQIIQLAKRLGKAKGISPSKAIDEAIKADLKNRNQVPV